MMSRTVVKFMKVKGVTFLSENMTKFMKIAEVALLPLFLPLTMTTWI